MGNQTTKLSLGSSSTEAMQSITLKVGGNSITIDQTGITIKGLMVSIEGQTQTQVKGLMTQINGDAMLQLKGGITMIG
jgi:type VI secretion system secreted protein VgrG